MRRTTSLTLVTPKVSRPDRGGCVTARLQQLWVQKVREGLGWGWGGYVGRGGVVWERDGGKRRKDGSLQVWSACLRMIVFKLENKVIAQLSPSSSPSCQLQPSWLSFSLILHFIHMFLHGPTWYRMGPYGLVWSHMVPYGPVYNPVDSYAPLLSLMASNSYPY